METVLADLSALVQDSSALSCVLSTAGVLVAWNALAQYEYRTRSLTRFFGSKQRANDAFGVFIIGCTLLRFTTFMSVAWWHNERLPRAFDMQSEYLSLWRAAALVAFSIGLYLILVTSKLLGWRGAYFGDHFDILMPAPITCFPYSHVKNPMYVGTAIWFLGIGLGLNSRFGVWLALWIHLTYAAAAAFVEGPSTRRIYAAASKRSAEPVNAAKEATALERGSSVRTAKTK